MPGEKPSPAELTYRSRKRTWLVFLVLVTVLFILQMAALAGVMVLAVIRGVEEFGGLPLTAEERGVLVRIDDLVEDSAETDEILRKWRGRHGATHLRSRGIAERERGAVRVYCEVVITGGPDEATQHYLQLSMSQDARQYVDRRGELVSTAQSDLYTWGEESQVYTLARDHQPAGILFLARKEGTVFLLAISGRKLEDPKLIEMLLGPVLRKVDRYGK